MLNIVSCMYVCVHLLQSGTKVSVPPSLQVVSSCLLFIIWSIVVRTRVRFEFEHAFQEVCLSQAQTLKDLFSNVSILNPPKMLNVNFQIKILIVSFLNIHEKSRQTQAID